MSDDEKGFTPKAAAAADQSMTWVMDNFPRLWWGLYSRCVEEGFTAEAALILVVNYIQATNRRTA